MPCHAKIDCPFNIAEFIDQITISWLSITNPSKYGFLGPAPYHVNDTGLEAQNAPTHLNPAGGIRSKMSTQWLCCTPSTHTKLSHRSSKSRSSASRPHTQLKPPPTPSNMVSLSRSLPGDAAGTSDVESNMLGRWSESEPLLVDHVAPTIQTGPAIFHAIYCGRTLNRPPSHHA